MSPGVSIGGNDAHPCHACNPKLLCSHTRKVDNAPFAERAAIVDRDDDGLAGFEMRNQYAAAEREVFVRRRQGVRVGPAARCVPASVRIEGRHALLLERLGFGSGRVTLGFGRHALRKCRHYGDAKCRAERSGSPQASQVRHISPDRDSGPPGLNPLCNDGKPPISDRMLTFHSRIFSISTVGNRAVA